VANIWENSYEFSQFWKLVNFSSLAMFLNKHKTYRMRKWNWLYWLTTGLLSLFMIFSAYMYVFSVQMIAAFEYLLLPDYFRLELAVAKVLGAFVLVLPFPRWLKEWAYAGFFITFVSAIVAHLAVNDPVSATFGPLTALLLLFASYLGFRQRE